MIQEIQSVDGPVEKKRKSALGGGPNGHYLQILFLDSMFCPLNSDLKALFFLLRSGRN